MRNRPGRNNTLPNLLTQSDKRSLLACEKKSDAPSGNLRNPVKFNERKSRRYVPTMKVSMKVSIKHEGVK